MTGIIPTIIGSRGKKNLVIYVACLVVLFIVAFGSFLFLLIVGANSNATNVNPQTSQYSSFDKLTNDSSGQFGKFTITNSSVDYNSAEHQLTVTFTANNVDASSISGVVAESTVTHFSAVNKNIAEPVSKGFGAGSLSFSGKSSQVVKVQVAVSPDLPTDQYYISSAILSRGGQVLNTDYPLNTVNLNGSGQFLSIDPSSVTVTANGKTEPAVAVPVLASGDSISANLTVVNGSAQSITAVPEISVFRNANTGQAAVSSQKGDSVTINQGTSQKYQLTMPNIANPGSYLAEISYRQSNDLIVSGVTTVGWVVAGTSANIASVQTGKVSSKNGRLSIPMAINVVGSPDGKSSIGNAKLQVTAKDSKGNVLKTVSTNINIPATTRMLVPVTLSSWSSLSSNSLLTYDYTLTSASGAKLDSGSGQLMLSNVSSTIGLWILGVIVIVITALLGTAINLLKNLRSVKSSNGTN